MAKDKKVKAEKPNMEAILKMTIEEAIFNIAEKDGYSVETLKELERMTRKGGSTYVSLSEYSSDESLNTEVANHVININVDYEGQKIKDKETLMKFNVADVNVESFNYDSIDTDGVPLDVFKKQVSEALPIALNELLNPSSGTRANYNYKFNKVLFYNFSTNNFLVYGISQSKDVVTEGVYKVVKSAPLTVAKDMIKKTADLRTSKIRTFKVNNLKGGVRVRGEILEVGGGK